MMETMLPDDLEDQETKLLMKWLPVLSGKERAYLKGAIDALLYTQESTCTTKMEHPDTFLPEK